MTLIVHTARLSQALRSVPDVLNVTRKSGDELGRVFAPSWAILLPALEARRAGRDEEHWPAYVDAYTAEMRSSYREHRATWEALLARESATLVCYCSPDADGKLRCHRVLLAGMLAKLGAEYAGER